MATLPELCRDNTSLPEAAVAHLQRLVGAWGMLSDLCFADLLLFVPVSSPPGAADPASSREPGGGSSGEVSRPAPAGSATAGGGSGGDLSRPAPAGPGVALAPADGDNGDRFLVVGQVRPTTSQTLHRADLVGQITDSPDRPVVARAWHLGSIVEGEVAIPSRGERGRLVCIPVRWQDQLVAILTRESALSVGRRPGELERVYVEVFDRLARMISVGEFPFAVADEVTTEAPPRVGDGVLVLDSSGRVDYASPNAVNALHRVGMHSGIDGVRLEEAGLEQAAVRLSYATGLPATEEVMRGGDVALVLRCIPLLDHGTLTGSLVLLRDVTDLRRRDRLLLSKDAAIREVHHRVKNNLQTISSLLRLQARRLNEGEARKALEESERRVRSIALVHEILARDTKDQVDFNAILPSLVRMAEDLAPSARPVRVSHGGDAGSLPAGVATPLAVVLTELLQNAAEHAFPHPDDRVAGIGGSAGFDAGSESVTADAGDEDGHERQSADRTGAGAARGGDGALQVAITFRRGAAALDVEVRDNGIGLPSGFAIESTSSLGLSIVRGLVESQMGGRITMRSDGGTVVELHLPVDRADEDPGGLSGL